MPAGALKVPVLFRRAVPEIPSTTYGAFGIYKYPAKFIPQVIAYVLKTYAKPGMVVFDPFAGYGTVGVVARVYGFDYELWDLNPILEVIHETTLLKPWRVDLRALMDEMKASRQEFLPSWSNLHYWFPEPFLPLLSRAWGFVHALEDQTKYLLLIPLMKVTRYFSYDDEKVHKLYRSRYSRRKIGSLLQDDWEARFYALLRAEVETLLKKLREYRRLRPKAVQWRVRAGVDTLEENLDREVGILVTSPPYLQAQEYIRSTKLELFWLGYDEATIRELSKNEIPYRPVRPISIHSDTYHTYLEIIEEPHLRRIYERYFHAILGAFSALAERVAGYLCLFVGPAKVRETPIPIDDILVEHLTALGWAHEVTLVDTIVSRVMFRSRTNPASGAKDSRIETEHLVVLKRV